MPDAIRDIMKSPETLSARMGQHAGFVREHFDLDLVKDHERVAYHQDMAATRGMASVFADRDVTIVLYAKPGSLRHQLLREAGFPSTDPRD